MDDELTRAELLALGIAALILSPLFLFRAWQERMSGRWIHNERSNHP
jgi:hypothetical protein